MTAPARICSFCLRSHDDAVVVIAGPAYRSGQAFICDACVDLCAEILWERRVGLPGLAGRYHEAMGAALETAA